MSTLNQLLELSWSAYFDTFDPHLPWLDTARGCQSCFMSCCFHNGPAPSAPSAPSYSAEFSTATRHATALLQQHAPESRNLSLSIFELSTHGASVAHVASLARWLHLEWKPNPSHQKMEMVFVRTTTFAGER